MEALVPPDPTTRVRAPIPLRAPGVVTVGDEATDERRSAGRATTRAALLMVLAGIGAVVGSTLPWGTMTAWFGSTTLAGTTGNGVLTLAAGAFLTVVGVLAWRSWASYRLVVLGLVAACAVVAIAGYNAIDLAGFGRERGLVGVELGYGLWVTLGSGVAGILGASVVIQRP